MERKNSAEVELARARIDVMQVHNNDDVVDDAADEDDVNDI